MASLRSARRCFSAVVSDVDGLRRLSDAPPSLDLHRPAVSGWSVGQHVDHLAASDEVVLAGLRRILKTAGDPEAEAGSGSGPNLLARVCLLTGWIPRGRGQAPKAVLPGESVDAERLAARLDVLQDGLRSLEPELPRLAASSVREPHPILGRLHPVEWLRFLQVHHRHHLKIVRDIRRASGA